MAVDADELDEQLSHPLAGQLQPLSAQPATAAMRTTATHKIAFRIVSLR
jgi:hypothetical protein